MIPIVQVKNVWCPNCGRQEFELRYNLYCTNCGTGVEWSKTWEEWYSSSSPGKVFAHDFPSGTKWEESGTGWLVMVHQYDPNTGKRLADPKVLQCLKSARKELEKGLARIDHKVSTLTDVEGR